MKWTMEAAVWGKAKAYDLANQESVCLCVKVASIEKVEVGRR